MGGACCSSCSSTNTNQTVSHSRTNNLTEEEQTIRRELLASTAEKRLEAQRNRGVKQKK